MDSIDISKSSHDLVKLIFYYDVFIIQFSEKAKRGLSRILPVVFLSLLLQLILTGTIIGAIFTIFNYAFLAFLFLVTVDILRKRIQPYYKEKKLIKFYSLGAFLNIHGTKEFTLKGKNEIFKYNWTKVKCLNVISKYGFLVIRFFDGKILYIPTIKETTGNVIKNILKENPHIQMNVI